MKKSTQRESLLNTLAREVGRAAGTIANATQGLSIRDSATVQADKKRGKTTGVSRRRVVPKKKKGAKSANRRSKAKRANDSSR
jgi:hypothetical protein